MRKGRREGVEGKGGDASGEKKEGRGENKHR